MKKKFEDYIDIIKMMMRRWTNLSLKVKGRNV